jgi:hypothetical protein
MQLSAFREVEGKSHFAQAGYFICIFKGVQLQSKFHGNGTGSAAAQQPSHLCYRPIVFCRHLRLIKLSFPQGKIRRNLKNVINSFFLLSSNCVSLK